MSKIIAHIPLVVLLGVGACAPLSQDSQSLQAAAKSAYIEATPIADGVNAMPPPGFVSFCMRSPQACTNNAPVRDARVAIDDRTVSLLVAVNARVNAAITYKSDPEHYGVANRWTLTPEGGYGDCKDYALAKREALRASGMPDSALRIAIVRTASDELHAVLTVDTDRGVLVLDSLTPEIRSWSDTNYEWLMRQASDNPMRWVAVTDAATRASANTVARNPAS